MLKLETLDWDESWDHRFAHFVVVPPNAPNLRVDMHTQQWVHRYTFHLNFVRRNDTMRRVTSGLSVASSTNWLSLPLHSSPLTSLLWQSEFASSNSFSFYDYLYYIARRKIVNEQPPVLPSTCSMELHFLVGISIFPN
jgi:hypothetical protein